MQTQINSETLQQLRSEIEAITTLQLALNRVALSVDGDSLSQWEGPRVEDVEDVAADDGSFERESVLELRRKAGEALASRYSEVERVIMGRAALESLVRTALGTGTGGVVTTDGPPPAQVLSALARSGAIRLDWAQEAAAQVREVLDAKAEAPPPAKAPKAPKAPAKPSRPSVVAVAKKAKDTATARVKAAVAKVKEKKPAPKAKAKAAAKATRGKPVRATVKTVVKAAAKAVASTVKKAAAAAKQKKSPAKKK